MKTVLGTIFYKNIEVQVIEEDLPNSFKFYFEYFKGGVKTQLILVFPTMFLVSKETSLTYVLKKFDDEDNEIGVENGSFAYPTPDEFNKWNNHEVTNYTGKIRVFVFNTSMNGIVSKIFNDINFYPFDPSANFSLSQPIICNAIVLDNTITVNIDNIGVGQIPQYKIDGLTDWGSSNVFENVPNGDYTVLVRSDVRLWKSEILVNVNYEGLGNE